jgi:ABC-type antimicrobial peptide transport system permease subunit
LPDPQTAGISQLLLIVSLVLVLLAVVNATFISWSTVLDSRRPLAVARALGATPDDAVSSISAAQLIPALVGALLGIPGGLGLYHITKRGGGPSTFPPAWPLAGVVLGAVIVVAVLTAIPARIGARRPVVEILPTQAA